MNTLWSCPELRSIRRFVLIVLVAAIVILPLCIDWVWSQTPTAIRKRQVAAIARIEACGGKVEPSQPRNDTPRELGVLQGCSVDFTGANVTDDDLAVLDELQAPIALSLAGTSITDKGVKIVSRLKASHVESLDLSGTRITDDALVSIQGLSHLSYLNLSDTKITDAEMSRLPVQQNPFVLQISRTQVGDEGLRHICAKLISHPPACSTYLDLSGTMVSDVGLIHFRGIRVVRLDLSDTKITGAGLQELGKSGRIETLYLSNTQITDQDLTSLVAIPGLDAIILRGTSITDQGLVQLRKIGALRYLDVTGSKVTEAGIVELKKAFPKPPEVVGP